MQSPRLLRNPIRTYRWGSRTALAELLGEPSPAAEPQAELWMGAHPSDPSQVEVDGAWIPLCDWIAREPASILGDAVASRFGSKLPFLLKVLAAERPLSLQAHPDAEQARAGFARENEAGIPLDAPQRCYRDPHPKPELVCALTPFAALCGFRTPAEIVAQVDELRAHRLAALAAPLRGESADGGALRSFYAALMQLDRDASEAVVADVLAAAESGNGDPAIRGWLRKLADAYPGDPGVLAPILLHFLELQPGQALFLPAGELHAYLHGTAVEIMANSDNVLRGGLTEKHVALPELLSTLRFEPRKPPILDGRSSGAGEVAYETPAREFALSRIELSGEAGCECGDRDSVEILLCTRGEAVLEAGADASVLRLARGAAALVPADVDSYALRGDATVYRARVPGGAP